MVFVFSVLVLVVEVCTCCVEEVAGLTVIVEDCIGAVLALPSGLTVIEAELVGAGAADDDGAAED